MTQANEFLLIQARRKRSKARDTRLSRPAAVRRRLRAAKHYGWWLDARFLSCWGNAATVFQTTAQPRRSKPAVP